MEKQMARIAARKAFDEQYAVRQRTGPTSRCIGKQSLPRNREKVVFQLRSARQSGFSDAEVLQIPRSHRPCYQVEGDLRREKLE